MGGSNPADIIALPNSMPTHPRGHPRHPHFLRVVLLALVSSIRANVSDVPSDVPSDESQNLIAELILGPQKWPNQKNWTHLRLQKKATYGFRCFFRLMACGTKTYKIHVTKSYNWNSSSPARAFQTINPPSFLRHLHLSGRMVRREEIMVPWSQNNTRREWVAFGVWWLGGWV